MFILIVRVYFLSPPLLFSLCFPFSVVLLLVASQYHNWVFLLFLDLQQKLVMQVSGYTICTVGGSWWSQCGSCDRYHTCYCWWSLNKPETVTVVLSSHFRKPYLEIFLRLKRRRFNQRFLFGIFCLLKSSTGVFLGFLNPLWGALEGLLFLQKNMLLEFSSLFLLLGSSCSFFLVVYLSWFFWSLLSFC